MSKRPDFTNTPTAGLLALAHRRMGKRGFYDVIDELHKRGSRDIFDYAATCCKSIDPRERMMGADILGQLGRQKDKFRTPSIKQLVGLLHDDDLRVVCRATSAIGHRRASEAVPRLVELSKHKRSRVRFGVVFGLLCQDSEPAVATMIELSRDHDAEVRNWATFGLARQIDIDTPAIRAALIDRLTETDPEIRSEALEGLASRRHPDALQWIQAALAEADIITGYLEAAATLGDPALLPTLQNIKEKWPPGPESYNYFYNVLDDAIKACSA